MFQGMSPEEQAQMSFALRMMQGGGPSAQPVGFGQNIGNAGLGAMGDYSQLIAQAAAQKQQQRAMEVDEQRMKQQMEVQKHQMKMAEMGVGLDQRKLELESDKFLAENEREKRKTQSLDAVKQFGLGSPLAGLSQQQGELAPVQQAGIGMMANAPDMQTYLTGFDQTYGYKPPAPEKKNYGVTTSGDQLLAYNQADPRDKFVLGPAKTPAPPKPAKDRSVDYGFKIGDDLARDIKPIEELEGKVRYLRSILPNWRDPAVSQEIQRAMSNLTETGSRAQAEVAAWRGGNFGNLSQRLVGKATQFLGGRYTEDSAKQIDGLLTELEGNLLKPSKELIVRGHAQRAESVGANTDAAIPGHYKSLLAGEPPQEKPATPSRKISAKPKGASDEDWNEYLSLTGGGP